ncbi:MAG: DUF3817 domain-containing protein [Saprospiraceae bacterium]|nr:DUF3817 domain-containing protein [Saprospiraceae bacterium]
MFRTPLGRFRIVAFLEGISFLLLGFTMVLKYQYAMPRPNFVVGLAHGVLFVAYVFLLIRVTVIYEWSSRKFVLAFLASLLPFGTFVADKNLFRK